MILLGKQHKKLKISSYWYYKFYIVSHLNIETCLGALLLILFPYLKQRCQLLRKIWQFPIIVLKFTTARLFDITLKSEVANVRHDFASCLRIEHVSYREKKMLLLKGYRLQDSRRVETLWQTHQTWWSQALMKIRSRNFVKGSRPLEHFRWY